MTDQPDHRAEAEKWLERAAMVIRNHAHTPVAEEARAAAEYGRVARTFSLIGIGHAILAAFPDDDGGWEGLPPGDTISLPSSAHTIGAGMHTPKPTDQQSYR
jgi:hypothetical protein